MITSSNAAYTEHELREIRQIAMTGARVSRALDDVELLHDHIRQARRANRLIVKSRATLRTEARVS